MEVFDLTYRDLLSKLADINLVERAQALGLEFRSGRIVIPFFGHRHFISAQGVTDRDGKTPTPAVATVLLNYTLRNTQLPPPDTEILSFNDRPKTIWTSKASLSWEPTLPAGLSNFPARVRNR